MMLLLSRQEKRWRTSTATTLYFIRPHTRKMCLPIMMIATTTIRSLHKIYIDMKCQRLLLFV
jgi:hypothetical protein